MTFDAAARAERWDVLLQHRAALLRVARARTTCREDAEDCVQEALARAVEFENLDLDRAGAFLTTTTIRLTADLHRNRTRQRRIAHRVGGQAEVTGDLVEDITDHALARWLHQQTQALSEQEQAVLRARVAGDSSRDAALALGISVRAAESSLTRVRTKLQSAWLRVAVFLGALGLTARRTASVSLPLTAVAATVALGPVQLLPQTDAHRPPQVLSTPSTPVVAPSGSETASTAPTTTSAPVRPVAVAARRTPVAAPTQPAAAAPAPTSRHRHGHHEDCDCSSPVLPVSVSVDLLQGKAGVQLGSPGNPSMLRLFLSLR
jgi:RNA polymerase sigma-70 factor (ECF subfamily)